MACGRPHGEQRSVESGDGGRRAHPGRVGTSKAAPTPNCHLPPAELRPQAQKQLVTCLRSLVDG